MGPRSRGGSFDYTGSRSNHRKHHFKTLQPFERMRLMGGHENQLAAADLMRFPSDGNFDLSFQHLRQRIEWGCTLAQALLLVERRRQLRYRLSSS